MHNVTLLDWILVAGVVLLGVILSVYFKKKYRIDKLDFLVVSVYIAGVASILIGLYHLLRSYLSLTP